MRAIGSDVSLDIVASQQHGVLERTGLSTEQATVSAWTVASDDEVSVGGARAIALAIAVGRNARWPTVFWRLPGFGWLADRVYLLVARYRYRLPGETPWCTAHEGECTDVDS